MLTYLYCDIAITTKIVISELVQAEFDKVGITFYLENMEQQSTDFLWSHHWLSLTDEKLISYSKEKCHWLRFPNLADFQISLNAKEITSYPVLGTPPETTKHLLLDQVLPRCLAYQGKTMVHASAVRFEHGLILFLGDSGVGKSTLAGNFHQLGNPIVSDDCLMLKEGKNGIKGIPTYGGVRLWNDSLEVLFPPEQGVDPVAHYSTKKRVALDEKDALKLRKGLPVLAMFVLFPRDPVLGSEITLERLSNREAFITLMKQTFQLDVHDLKRIERHMRRLGRIVSKLPAYRLSMPHKYELLPLVRKKILQTVQAMVA